MYNTCKHSKQRPSDAAPMHYVLMFVICRLFVVVLLLLWWFLFVGFCEGEGGCRRGCVYVFGGWVVLLLLFRCCFVLLWVVVLLLFDITLIIAD